jgi:putative peptide zinc metalloprotease protein
MSDEPLQSPLWYRVADLRPKLAVRARLHRHRYRGEVWYLLQDLASGKVHRFTPAARIVIAAMDGVRSVRELWDLASRRLGKEAPTQDELIQLLGQLHGADLLTTDVPPDALELFDRGERENRTKRRRSWTNPMALRIPLWNPGSFLDQHTAWWQHIWGRAGAILWLLLVLPALLLVPAHWPELTHGISDRVLQADNLVLMALLFPLIKALHELGHATATRAAGGAVHDMGLMLLVMMPVPYVDASAANVLRSRWARARIGAAGMIVELFLAALAFYLWLLIEPGLLRAACFNVMLVAGVSTVVFNGNPLLRYDAYYILADLIELPNLASQSARYWGYLLQRYWLRLRDVVSPARTRSERWWFGLYGVASTAYRAVVTLAIALVVASQFFFIGVLLALWAVLSMAVWPLVRSLKALTQRSEVRERRGAILSRILLTLAFVLGLLVWVPMPMRTQAEGVVWLPEQAILRAGASGFFERFEVAPGATVQQGQVIAHSVDPALAAQLVVLEARVAELEATHAEAYVNDRARAEIALEQLEQERTALNRARERAQGLTLTAGAAGRLTVEQPGDLPGRYIRQGEVVGYLIGNVAPVVRVVIDQSVVERVAAATREVDIKLQGRLDQTLRARIERQVPAGTESLPSRALTPMGGGQFAVDPADPDGRRTLERVFELDLAFVDVPAQEPLFGQRVHVRFDLIAVPLATQLWWAVRRLFLRHFDV